ncbi:glycosyltransferase [Marinobacterium sp. D7]|uniref:glycosyltransferase n=1 Tax=Marinobacterium ramblicola TaxID=2849041 RepID=UPI001C2DE416|nr:glycosyltransferase [Marinobacterium ramblicola]MBV1788886.1 glycosyltransferase [Marinobacterium ramblicola]
MRIAFISKADAAGGGASRIAQDLAEGLQALGHETVHWVSWSKSGYDARRRRLYGERWQRQFYRYSRKVKRWFAPDIIPFEWPNLYWQNLPANFDLLHVHDISSAMSAWSLRRLAGDMPVLWTQHDCSAFTGGCIYPLGCQRYRQGCGDCPQHGRWPLDSRFDYSRLKRKANQKALSTASLALATPSQWLQQWALDSGHVFTVPRVLRNGVDTNVFRPGVKPVTGLPTIILAAASLSNPYKGVEDAIDALRWVVKQKPFRLLVVGDVDERLKCAFEGLPVHFTGLISDQRLLAEQYNQANLLLFPSLAENQPLQLLEAMACAVPAVAYATGGIPEIVQQDRGWLVEKGNKQRLGEQLLTALSDPRLAEVGKRAHQWVVANHRQELMLEEHLLHYSSIIEEWQRSKRLVVSNR